MSRPARIALTLVLAGALALFVLGALYSWGASIGIGFTYLNNEPPHQVQAYLRFSHLVFYGSVLGAISQIVGLILVWRGRRPMAPNSALLTDACESPLRAPHGAAKRER